MEFPCKVQYSQEGMKECRRRKPNRTGTALRINRKLGSNGAIAVNWDGNKPNSIMYIHPDFIEEVKNK